MAVRSALVVILTCLSLTAAHAADQPAPLSNKWRLQVSGGAESDGTLTFRVTPKGGAPTDVVVTLKDGRSENGVARDISAAFNAQLPKEHYASETDDGEDVLIKKRHGSPDFSIELASSSVEDVRIGFDRE